MPTETLKSVSDLKKLRDRIKKEENGKQKAEGGRRSALGHESILPFSSIGMKKQWLGKPRYISCPLQPLSLGKSVHKDYFNELSGLTVSVNNNCITTAKSHEKNALTGVSARWDS